MKDILIVTSPSTSHHESIGLKMKTEAEKNGTTVKLFHNTAILLSGPKSFEIARLLENIAERENLPIALFEVEAVLTPSKEQEDSKV